MRYLFLLLLLPHHCFAHVINWVVVDYPPYYILQGDMAGQGRDESVIDLLMPSLSEYEAKRHLMPASRAVKALNNPDELYCMVSLFRTKERENYIRFSDQYATLGLSPALAIRKDLAEKLQLSEHQPISLAELILLHELSIGVTLNRAYGTKIDAILTKTPRHQMTTRAGKDTLASLTMMLLKGRVDVILGYPSEHRYLQSMVKGGDELMQLTIAEADVVAKGFVGCSKNEHSEQAIAEINSSLSKLNKSSSFNSVMLKWLPVNMQPKLRKHLAY